MQSTKARSALGIDRAVLGVVGRFTAYFAALVLAVLLANAMGAWQNVQLGTAWLSTTIAAGLGVSAARSGTLIYLPGRTLSIDLACTAVFVVALFSALLLAYPVRARERLLGIALGVPVILAFNVVRIVAATQVAVRAPGAFQFFHDYLFEVGMVLVTVALWTMWLSHARRSAR